MMISAACFGAKAVFLNVLCEAACSVNTNRFHRCQGVSRAVFIESPTNSPTNRPTRADIAEQRARGRVTFSSLLRYWILIYQLPFTPYFRIKTQCTTSICCLES